jgi:hypothetical protein
VAAAAAALTTACRTCRKPFSVLQLIDTCSLMTKAALV